MSMPYAITFVRIKRKENREMVLSNPEDLIRPSLKKTLKDVELQHIFFSFGWPDFIVTLKAPNLELLQQAVSQIKDDLAKKGVFTESTTMVGVTAEEIEEQKKTWMERP